MRFKKIYIEITNKCNFACSFCTTSNRNTGFMKSSDFEKIIEKIKPYTQYVYLHVLGEPLLHPQIAEILHIANSHDIHVNISTNGSLLHKRLNILLHEKPRQINVSLHDAYENVKIEKWEQYFDDIIDATKKLAPHTYMNLRLWNQGVDNVNAFNQVCLQALAQAFEIPLPDLHYNEGKMSVRLAEHVFLQYALRFSWPDNVQKKAPNTPVNCYALRDHVAILLNGDVVPCCIDANAQMLLGNIFEDDLGKIIQNERALAIRKGFENHRAAESFCFSCGFHQ